MFVARYRVGESGLVGPTGHHTPDACPVLPGIDGSNQLQQRMLSFPDHSEIGPCLEEALLWLGGSMRTAEDDPTSSTLQSLDEIHSLMEVVRK